MSERPPRPPRPRRSAAAASTSYTHLLQPLNLTSSSSSSGNDSDSDSTKRARRLKKKKTSFIPEQDSDSEFEVPVKAEGGDDAGQGEEETSDDDEDEADLVSEEEDEGPSGQGEEDMSDIATSGGEIDQGSPDPSSRKGGRKGKTRNNRPLAPQEYSSGKQPRRSLVITKGTIPPIVDGEDGEIRRALPNRTISSGLDPQYSSFVPHYLPPQIKLSIKDDTSSSTSYSTARIVTSKKPTKGQTDRDSSSILERWTANPFAPERALVRDVGWEKGKWKEDGEGGGSVINEKWGGWYEEIQFNDDRDFEKVQQQYVSQYAHSLSLS